MSTYTVIIEPSAVESIENIKYYLKHVLYATKASQDFETALYKKLELISKNPHLYRGEWIGNKYYYIVAIKNYIAAYQVKESTQTIHIMAVGHSLQKRIHVIKRR